VRTCVFATAPTERTGQLGVMDEHCMHRGVSLAVGRNEEGDLRCLYHGWKFAVGRSNSNLHR
jgi:nitrite reductase/ring-hydroxylating ferredoxin subunit